MNLLDYRTSAKGCWAQEFLKHFTLPGCRGSLGHWLSGNFKGPRVVVYSLKLPKAVLEKIRPRNSALSDKPKATGSSSV